MISGDSHVREPVNLWSDAMGKKYGDRTPRPLTEHRGREGKFFFNGQRVSKYAVSEVRPEDRTPRRTCLSDRDSIPTSVSNSRRGPASRPR